MFVKYTVARSPDLPEIGPYLYEYVLAAGGLYVRAGRPGLQALLLLAPSEPVRGFASLTPYLRLSERVPSDLLEAMLFFSQASLPSEILFYLLPSPWRLSFPHQIAGPASVRPEDAFGPDYQSALVEVHSHGLMDAFFSAADDRDETGFRLYAVLGRLDGQPVIRCRLSIYGHFFTIPADWVFDLPPGLRDASLPGEPVVIEDVFQDLEDPDLMGLWTEQ